MQATAIRFGNQENALRPVHKELLNSSHPLQVTFDKKNYSLIGMEQTGCIYSLNLTRADIQSRIEMKAYTKGTTNTSELVPCTIQPRLFNIFVTDPRVKKVEPVK